MMYFDIIKKIVSAVRETLSNGNKRLPNLDFTGILIAFLFLEMESINIFAKNIFLNEVAGAGTEMKLWVSCGLKTNNTTLRHGESVHYSKTNYIYIFFFNAVMAKVSSLYSIKIVAFWVFTNYTTWALS